MIYEKINRFLNNNLIVATILFIYSLLMFYPIIQGNYLFHDDYLNFNEGSGKCPWSPISINWYSDMGRPLGGWILCGYSKFVHSSEEGSLVRFFILVSIAVMAYLLFVYLVKNNIAPLKALLLSALTLTVPAVAICAFWITASFIVVGAIFSIISGLIAYHVLENRIHGLNKIFFLMLSVVFFGAATLTYQPSAMVYWGLLAFSLWHWLTDDDLLWAQKTIQMGSLGIISMALYGLWYIPTSYQNLKVADPSRSMHPLNSTLGRINDFFHTSMPIIHRFWFANPITWFPWFLIGVIIVGITVSRLSIGKKISLLLLYPILCGIAFSPVLVSNFPVTFLRTMFPVWIVVIAYMSGAVASIAHASTQKLQSEMFLIVSFLIGGTILQFHFVRDTLVKPAVFELTYAKNRLNLIKKNPDIKTILLCPLHYQVISPILSDEYGSPTSAFIQDVPSFVGETLKSVHFTHAISLVMENKCSHASEVTATTLDLTGMLQSKLWPAMLETMPTEK